MKKDYEKIPAAAAWLLKRILPDYDRISLRGDFDEMYFEQKNRKGVLNANIWLLIQMFRSIPNFFKKSLYWSMIMFRNYLKVAFRNLVRQKYYSVINITGLAIGMAVSFLILLWVQDEISFDDFHRNKDDIYRIVISNRDGSGDWAAVSALPLGTTLKQELPEVICSATLSFPSTLMFSNEDKNFNISDGYFADPDFFKIFSFDFIYGDPEEPFRDPRSLVVTREIAERFFGEINPVGKILLANNRAAYTITGVVEDLPLRSHIRFNFIRPFALLEMFGADRTEWSDVSYFTYLQIEENCVIEELESKIDQIVLNHHPDDNNKCFLQPLKDIHLSNKYFYDIAVTGDIKYIYIFSTAALFILIIACINYINLSTAKASRRAKEVGLRKVVGAGRIEIIKQFFSESILYTLIAFLMSLMVVRLSIPGFNTLTGKMFDMNVFDNTGMVFGLSAIAFLTGLLSSSYPALLISSFKPVSVFKGTVLTENRGRSYFRKVMVITQFALSVILIVSTLVVSGQTGYMRNKDLGFNKEQIVYFRLRGGIRASNNAAKEMLLRNESVLDASVIDMLPITLGSGTDGADWEGKNDDEAIQMQVRFVDFDFLKTFDMKINEGRFFSRDFPSDSMSAFVVNQAAVKAMKMESPLGKRFSAFGVEGRIIGVVEDFNFMSLHSRISPLFMLCGGPRTNYMCLKVKSENLSDTINSIESVWDKFSTGFPFEYGFLDERIDNLYRTEMRIGKIFRYFTFLAIFISCLGLFGLTSFMAENRTKEIGVRKVLGASVKNITVSLSKEFLYWVISANILAWPVSYAIMNTWLEGFAYRIDIGWTVYILAGAITLVITFTTTSFQIIKAAIVNPVRSLRYE